MTASPAAPIAPPAAPTAQVIVGQGIVKRFGSKVVLDGADLAVPAGVTGLLGPNGAGKTTLLGLLLGLGRAQAGRIEVLGMDPTRAGPEIRARVGYAPEHHLLPPDVPAHDFVAHVAEVHGLPRRAATGRASDALWWVGLGEERFRPLGTMSTGQRQRVKLAMAVAHDPALVFLDEPTDGLDPTQRDAMLELVRRISTEFGINVLLSSHLLDEVERTCDEVVILDGGKVVAAGSIDELRGAGRGVRLEIAGDPNLLVEHLAASGLTVEVEGSRLVVAGVDGIEADQLLRVIQDAVVATGVGVRRLETRVVSLEDVYLGVGT